MNQQPTDQKKCATCAHAFQEQMQGQIVRQLVCHESPPNSCMVPVTGPHGQHGMQGVTMFPVVQPHMFCSRWQAVKVEIPSE